jgi:hypothetical protein
MVGARAEQPAATRQVICGRIRKALDGESPSVFLVCSDGSSPAVSL